MFNHVSSRSKNITIVLGLPSLVCLLLVGLLLPNTTQAQQTSVPATFHKQEHKLSCEIATLKMALGTYGIDVPETALLTNLPFDPTNKQPGLWGNPDQGFVGDINGKMLITGYGVYWQPIADLATRYAHAKVLKQTSATQVAQHIADGQPVIMWGYIGSGKPYSWQTPQGITISAVDGEHTRLIYGFDGPPASPTYFYLLDPLTGHLKWTAEQLMRNWSVFQHTGVAITHPRWVRGVGDGKIWEISPDGLTRRWLTSWKIFINRGGSHHAVVTLADKELNTYTIGSPIF